MARRASLCWDDDRRLVAEELFERLSANPPLIHARLIRTKQGCNALLDRWDDLERAALAQDSWTDAQRRRAADLLGQAADRPEAEHESDPASDLATARAEIEALRRRRDGALSDLDARERAAAELGHAHEPDRTLSALRRHESSCRRWLQWACAQFRKSRPDARPSAPTPGPRRPEPPAEHSPGSEAQLRATLLARLARQEPPPPPGPASIPLAIRTPDDPSRAPALNRRRRRALDRLRRAASA